MLYLFCVEQTRQRKHCWLSVIAPRSYSRRLFSHKWHSFPSMSTIILWDVYWQTYTHIYILTPYCETFFSWACVWTQNGILGRLKWEAAGARTQSGWLGYDAKAFLQIEKRQRDEFLTDGDTVWSSLLSSNRPQCFLPEKKNAGNEWLSIEYINRLNNEV